MPNEKPRKPFPAWRLPKGMIKASNEELEQSVESCERWEWFGGGLVFVGVAAAVAIAAIHPPYDSFLEQWGSAIADGLVAIGVATEIKFGQMAGLRQNELKQRSEILAVEANERATKADLARIKLEAKLVPRSLNQEQWDFIQSLRGKFPIVSIAYELDVETQWFAGQIREAFFSAGTSVAEYPRAPDVHSFGTFIFEPGGFDGTKPRTSGPLIEIFSRSESVGSLAIITEIPSDIARSIENTRPELRAPSDTPMIILGGRFVIPPFHLEKAAKMAKAARDNLRGARESSI
jgi:hypothetical protein